MSVYNSLVYSHLQYAIVCWKNPSKTIQLKLQVKQNCTIKTRGGVLEDVLGLEDTF